MKNRILGVVILTVSLISTAFAKKLNDNVSQKVLTTFSQKFTHASDVSWSKSDGYYKAAFTWNEQTLFAYISKTGEMLGFSRNLSSNQLPINLQTALKKDFTHSWVTELFEFTSDDETVYYAIVENAGKKVTLKSNGTNAWMVYNKEKKH